MMDSITGFLSFSSLNEDEKNKAVILEARIILDSLISEDQSLLNLDTRLVDAFADLEAAFVSNSIAEYKSLLRHCVFLIMAIAFGNAKRSFYPLNYDFAEIEKNYRNFDCLTDKTLPIRTSNDRNSSSL